MYYALLSERPYKPAWSFEDAVKEILNQRETKFDPGVVEAFVIVIPELRRIYQALAYETRRSVLTDSVESPSLPLK
jgi:response regulator RpfG family c-di-GMP phosphodiesterase